MRCETISIRVPGDPVPVDLISCVSDYTDSSDFTMERAVIICPGGCYAFLSERESMPVAARFVSEGFHAFVLHYHLPPAARFPLPQLDLAAALMHLRSHFEQYRIQPDKITVLGFSAGGHLACSLGVWYREDLFHTISNDPWQIRPDGLVLCYPVITGGRYTHQESMINLYNTVNAKTWEARSLENHVHSQMPPVFLWHTYEDATVPVENSLLLAEALRECAVPLEMHIFPHGPHGQSLGTEEVFDPGEEDRLRYPEIGLWPALAARWMREL